MSGMQIGEIIRRDEADNNSTNGDPHEIWYRYGGRQLGYDGNNPVLSACACRQPKGGRSTPITSIVSL